MAGGPSHLETFDYKPKLAEMNGQPMPESFTKGQPIAQLQGAKLTCFAPQHPFKKCGKSGQEIIDDLPAHRRGRRRPLHHPLDAHRGDQPRPGPHLHEHRHDHLRPAEHGLVAVVRPRQRVRQPARLRRADLDGQERPDAADRRPAVAQRLSAEPLPGRRVPLQGRSGAVRRQPARRQRRPPARRGRRGAGAQPACDNDVGRRPGDRHAHRAVRDGLPDADERAGPDGPVEGAERDLRPVRHARAATARSRPTACWPGGWPSAACASSSSTTATGTITAASRTTSQVVAKEVDQGAAALHHGPEAARHARRHAGDLGRRVRPHADGPGQRPRPPHQGLLDLAGRRRHQGRHHLRRHRRVRLQRRGGRRSTSTTCTPRCCSCWASTTRS